MKKIFTFLAAVILTAIVFAQAPEKMSYQAVVRDNANQLVTNTEISVKFSILDNIEGTALWIETQMATTNANGLLTVELGSEVSLDAGIFQNTPLFIKTEIDLEGGTDYTITGTSQLLSVPYAFYAKTAETVVGEITETDPTVPAHVKTITTDNVSDWNEAHGWGDHSAEGYLTDFTETDPTVPAHVKEIEIADIDNWNTAYKQGDAVDLASVQIQGVQVINQYGEWVGQLPDESDPVFGASVANSITATDTTNWNNKQNQLTTGTGIDITNNVISITSSVNSYSVGDFAHGGIVFLVDETGQHGLVCYKYNQSGRWYAGEYTNTLALGHFSGKMNTVIIIANQGIGDGDTYAARICNEMVLFEDDKYYGDWYLPSKQELFIMWQNREIIDATSTANGGSAFAVHENAIYWSSTEYNSVYAWAYLFCIPDFTDTPHIKDDIRYVRAVRTF